MIWYDNLNSFNTASYYVQQLFSLNKGTNVLSLTMNNKPVTGAAGQNGLFASAVWDKNQQEIIVKVVNTSDKSQPINLSFEGLKKKSKLANGKLITFESSDLLSENSIENPTLLQPVESNYKTEGTSINNTINAHAFQVYKLKLMK